jgi:hypothetical protein
MVACVTSGSRPYQTCSSNASASEHLHNICMRILIFVEVLPNKCTAMMPSSVLQTSRGYGMPLPIRPAGEFAMAIR